MMQQSKPNTIRRHPQIRPMFAGLRHYDRKAASVEVVIVDESGFEIPFESVNVSESGVFVASDYLYEVGQVHRLRLRNGEEQIELEGQVVRVEIGSARAKRASGMAYRFLPSKRETFYELAAMVAAL